MQLLRFLIEDRRKCTAQTFGQCLNRRTQRVHIRNGKLCRSRRRRGAKIGDLIRNAVVSLMTDGTDDRNRGAEYRPGDILGLECREVFIGAAASAHENDITVIAAGCFQCIGNGTRSEIALHECRIDADGPERIPPPQNLQHILQSRTAARGHNADLLRHRGQRALALLRKITELCEPFAALLQGERLSADAVRLHIGDIDLIGAVAFIERYRALQ